MKTVLFPDMHRRMPKAFAKALQADGWVILLPDMSFSPYIKYWKKWTQEELKENIYMKDCNNIKTISYQELFDNKPTAIMISCYEVESDVLKIYDSLSDKSIKLIHYAGNNYVPYSWDRLDNLITTDELIYQKSNFRNKNTLFYLPWVDFIGDYKFEEIKKSENINSYILHYNQYFPEAYKLAKQCSEILLPHKTTFIENANETEIPNLMNDSFATLHVKPIEGYGFSIIESMAKGRPVILFRPYAQSKTYKRWSFDMETCIFFDNMQELKEKYQYYIKNYQEIQARCSQKIRTIINNEVQNKRLINFFNNLI